MAPASPSSDFVFEEEEWDDESGEVPPPVWPIPIKLQHNEEEAQEDEQMTSNQASMVSVEGMDPLYANVLKRANSDASMKYGGSPLQRSVLAASAGSKADMIGKRRGAAYQEVRPASLVGQPEALAAELGLGMGMGMDMEGEGDERMWDSDGCGNVACPHACARADPTASGACCACRGSGGCRNADDCGRDG
jgi:hypothetical protein